LTESGQAPDNWTIGITSAFRKLTFEDMPSLEVLFVDMIAGWIFSPDNPGQDYGELHGSIAGALLFNAIRRAGEFRPAQLPAESWLMATARRAVVAGAHEIAEAEDGINQAIIELGSAAIEELEKNARNPGGQIYSLYWYSLFMISAGTMERISEPVARGIRETFIAWDSLMAGGFRLPWRTGHDNLPDSWQQGGHGRH
jgi:hypothetical protein